MTTTAFRRPTSSSARLPEFPAHLAAVRDAIIAASPQLVSAFAHDNNSTRGKLIWLSSRPEMIAQYAADAAEREKIANDQTAPDRRERLDAFNARWAEMHAARATDDEMKNARSSAPVAAIAPAAAIVDAAEKFTVCAGPDFYAESFSQAAKKRGALFDGISKGWYFKSEDDVASAFEEAGIIFRPARHCRKVMARDKERVAEILASIERAKNRAAAAAAAPRAISRGVFGRR